MAIRVEYFKNIQSCYSQGPFVMVNATGWRIEVDWSSECPALPDDSIYGFLREEHLPTGKFDDEDLCACIVDYLNAKTKGQYPKLIKSGKTWVWEPYEHIMEMKRLEERRRMSRCDGGYIGY